MTELKKLLMQVAEGEITPEEAELKLKMQPFEDMGFAKPDFHRGMRQGGFRGNLRGRQDSRADCCNYERIAFTWTKRCPDYQNV